jgi:cysteine sulfinate desulfinase/cysteine desulfurase-like protein
MGIPAGVARGAVRISLGQGNTPDEIGQLLDALETLPTPTFV